MAPCVLSSDLVREILIMLRLRRTTNSLNAKEMLLIQVKYGPSSETVSLNLSLETTIGEIKRELVKRLGNETNASEIAIIFSGKELSDDFRLDQCDLGQNSIIHAVKIKHKSQSESKMSKQPGILKDSLTNLTLVDSESFLNSSSNLTFSSSQTLDAQGNPKVDETVKHRFFVFCSSPKCKKVCYGKLRVKCDKCEMGTLTLNRDPNCWDDVLISGRIKGDCQNENCDGHIARFYFKCSSSIHNENNEDATAVVLHLIRYNSRQVPCLACTECCQVVLVFPCPDGHVICLDCFKTYCLSKLNERKFVIDPEIGYSLPCAVGCQKSLIREIHHFRLMGNDPYEKYQTFAAEECLLQAGGVLCPQPKCGAGIMLEFASEEEKRRITCNSCGFSFCRSCLQGYHIGECLTENEIDTNSAGVTRNDFSSIDPSNASRSKWEEKLTRDAIKEMTKPCPKCRTPTERDGGCMHIVCTRSNCGFNWCWVCQTEWNRECMGNHWFG